ncbi:hypothetical protein, partial [Ruminococcus callidus]|uniref:hypothetical protein n=1 Tax=Ruminococcus callidus TaxID=40519 RepID=UPI0023F6C284
FTPLFVSSDEKFDNASVAQSLCGIAVRFHGEAPLPNWNKMEFLSLSHKWKVSLLVKKEISCGNSL